MRTFRTTMIAFFVFITIGCTDQKKSVLWITNVVRVSMHEPDRYTLFSQRGGWLIPYEFAVPGRKPSDSNGNALVRCGIHLRTDVSRGEPMWATVERWGNSSTVKDDDCVLTIHIHDPAEIEGGGWDHGKLGRGTTQVIQ